MSTYRQADREHLVVLREVLDQYHPDLVEAGVTIRLLLAYGPRSEKTGLLTGPALKSRGWPCEGQAKVNSHEDRVAGLPDCTIRLDGDHLPEWSLEKLRYVLDHECQHFEVCRDSEGGIKLDDACRPKLKLRQHDAELGVFYAVVGRHDAPVVTEAQAALDVFRQLKQQEFDFGDLDLDRQPATPKLAAV